MGTMHPHMASRKLKVVRVVTASYVVPWHLDNTLKRMPADFEVCVVGQQVSQNRDLYPGVTFVDMDINRKVSPLADGRALIGLCRFFLSYRPDIVHSIMPKAGFLAALAGFICRVPIRMHTFTGQTWASMTGWSKHLYYGLDRLINALNTVCLTDSFSQSAYLMEHGISHQGKPLPVLSRGSLSGVNLARFDLARLAEPARQLRANLGIAPQNVVFAFIARKTRDKGAIDVLKAFSRVSSACTDARLLFVGPDEDGEIEELRKSAPALFANVIDVGQVSNHEQYLAITDVLCLPSYREGFGTIVIDAAAMGIPTIGTRIPGLLDAVDDGQTGVLFPAGDLSEMARLMQVFIDDPKVRRAMGDKARERVAAFFTADRLYAALRDCYWEYARLHPATREKLSVSP